MHINRKGLQFSKRDTWDYSTLGDIIVKWLESFKRDYEAHPFKGVPASYLPVGVAHPADEKIEAGQRQFMADIDKMIFAFSNNDMPDDCWKIKPSCDLLGSGELDWQKIEAHRAKLEEGRKLFAEKFGCLWI